MNRPLVASLVAASALFAGATASAQAYGDAGCGLGSLLFGDQPGALQILAATTNGFLGNQTFGITTGTLNCGGLSGSLASVDNYIVTNRHAVATDAARGGGEAIESLSALAGCADASLVGTTLQSHFDFIFPDAGVSDSAVSTTIIEILQHEESLACSFGA